MQPKLISWKYCAGMFIIFCAQMPGVVLGQGCPKWIPTLEEKNVNDQVTLKSQQVLWMREALLTIDAMAKRNASFSSIPNARLRNYLFAGIYYDASSNQKLTGEINLNAYSKKGWDEKCGIIPQADRIAANEAFIGFSLNNVDKDMLGSPELCPVHDDQLTAFFEPAPTGMIAGHELYDIGYFNLVLLTYNQKHPWIAVTAKQYLDFTERMMIKKQAALRTLLQQNETRQLDETATKKSYEEMKKSDVQKAEQYRLTIDAMRKAMNQHAVAAQREYASGDSAMHQEIAELRQYRESLPGAALQRQAIMGSGKYNLCLSGNCLNGRRLVQLDPDFIPYLKNKQIRIIGIRYIKASKQPGWAELVRETMERFDYDALQALMR